MCEPTASRNESVDGWVKTTLKNENLSNITVTITGNTEKGDGYLGDILFVLAEGTDPTGNQKTYNFVLKCGKKEESFRNNSPVRTAFEREIFIYKDLFPQLDQFQIEKFGQVIFKSYPKCFQTFLFDNMEVIILQNLRTIGYDLHNRKQCMNFEHVSLILKEYGKFHALSFALRDQKPELFEKLSTVEKDIMQEFIVAAPTFIESGLESMKDALKLLDKDKQSFVYEKCEEIVPKYCWAFTNLADEKDPHSVITHGDCWNNNFMFKYEGNDRQNPSAVAFLDWQISRVASPVFDLSYFLYSVSSKEILSNFDSLLKIYHESLKDTLKKLGSSPDLFPFDTLKLHWKKYSLFGMVMAPMILHFALADKDDVPDIYDIQDFEKIYESLKVTDNGGCYDERIVGVMENYAKYQAEY